MKFTQRAKDLEAFYWWIEFYHCQQNFKQQDIASSLF